MWQFFLTSWRAGFRGRSIQAVLLIGLMLVGVAYFAASFSPRQPQTVALDVGFSALRFSLVLFALFWIQELIGREIERRTVVFSLTYPTPRSAYILGRYLGVVSLLALAALLLGMALWALVFVSGQGYEQEHRVALGVPFWMTVIGLWLDACVVGAFALCVAALSTVPMLPLALGAGFAIAAKSLGAVSDYLTKGADGQVGLVENYLPLVDIIRWVLPDLSRLDWRSWPMYGLSPNTDLIVIPIFMAGCYIGVMLVCASTVFARRELF